MDKNLDTRNLKVAATGNQGSRRLQPVPNLVKVFGIIFVFLFSNTCLYSTMPFKIEHISCLTQGSPRAIVTKDNFVYIAATDALIVLDISNPGKIKQAGFYNISAFDVEVKDKLAFVAGSDENFRIMDISNPLGLKEIGNYCFQESEKRYRGFPSSIDDIEIDGNRAYLAATEQGLFIFDISTPTAPRKIGHYIKPTEMFNEIGESMGFDTFVNGVSAYKNMLFISDFCYGLRILDVSDPVSIKELGNLPIEHALSVSVNGGYAFVSYPYTVGIIDFSDPNNPKEVGTSRFSYTYSDENALEEIEFLGKKFKYTGFFPNLKMDLSSLEIPRDILGTLILGRKYQSKRKTECFFVGEDRAFNIIDIEDFTHLKVVGTYTAPSKVRKIFKYGNYLITSDEENHGILFTDINEIKNPRTIAKIKTIDIFYNIDVKDNLLYSVLDSKSLKIFDLEKDMLSPKLVGEFYNPRYRLGKIAIFGKYALISNLNEIKVFDIHDITNIKEVAEYSAGGYVQQIRMYRDLAFVILDKKIIIYEMKKCPELIGYEFRTSYECFDIDFFNDNAYLACGKDGLKILDISNLNNIKELVCNISFDRISCLKVHSGKIYIGMNKALRVFDILDPAELKEKASYETVAGISSILVDNDQIYLGVGRVGLWILRHSLEQ